MNLVSKDSVIRVVAAVIEQEGRFLLCQRPAHKRHGNQWELDSDKFPQSYQAAVVPVSKSGSGSR
jgi:hypothetical protein